MSVDASLSFAETWRLFAPAATVALGGLRRQRHGGQNCDADGCERCADDILDAVEMIYRDQGRYRNVAPAHVCVVIRNKFRDTILRPETARHGFSHRPERLVDRRSVRAAAPDPVDRMLLGQLIQHLAHDGQIAPLTDAHGRWLIDADMVNSLLTGIARRGRFPSRSTMPPAEELARRLVRCLARLAMTDRPLLDALDAAAARAATALPAEAALSSARDPMPWTAPGESPAYQAVVPHLADEFAKPLVELLLTAGTPRVDVLSALRAVIADRPVDPQLARLIHDDDEAARDIVDVVVDRLAKRR